MRSILTVVILKHVILSNIQLILVTVVLLNLSHNIHSNKVQIEHVVVYCYDPYGESEKTRLSQIWYDPVFSIFYPLWNHLIMLIPNGSTWNLYRCNCNAEKRFDRFFSKLKKKNIWRVNAKYSTNVVRVGLKLFRNFYDCDDKSDREARYEFFAKSTNENHRQSWFWSCLKRSKITLFSCS